LLAAARELLTERGYGRVKVTDVVARAGASTGSFYHHFGSKQDLFAELWRAHCAAQDRARDQAEAAAREAGQLDTVAVWAAGVRGVLQDAWQRKDLARLFLTGEVPPDFEAVRRDRDAELARRCARALGLSDSDQGRLYASCLQGMIQAGAQAAVEARDQAAARRAIDATVGYCLRLITASPLP
jgi:AcrR family transcriptional regulator